MRICRIRLCASTLIEGVSQIVTKEVMVLGDSLHYQLQLRED